MQLVNIYYQEFENYSFFAYAPRQYIYYQEFEN